MSRDTRQLLEVVIALSPWLAFLTVVVVVGAKSLLEDRGTEPDE